MQSPDYFASVMARSRALGPPPAGEEPEAQLRADAAAFFGRIPEPPLYPRSQEPLRSEAVSLLSQGEPLLARAWALLQAGRGSAADTTLTQALEAHLESLCATSEGHVERAETAWARGCALERTARQALRSWSREDEGPFPIYDGRTGTSRFDPRPAATMRARLICPNWTCRHVSEFSLPPSYAAHRLTCPRCSAAFLAYLGEARAVEVTASGSSRQFVFRLEALGGGLSRVEFHDGGKDAFPVARADLLAFLYTPQRELRGVSNLSASRTLWLTQAGPCFLAGHVYGSDGPELAAFRSFRDQVLQPSLLGRAAIAWYMGQGPSLVAVCRRHPSLDSAIRVVLRVLHRKLVRHGHGRPDAP